LSYLEELIQWLGVNWDPEMTLREWWKILAKSGWSQPLWPLEWYGKGLSRGEANEVRRTIREFGAVTGPPGFATGMAGPTLLVHGTDEQKSRFLPGIADGSDAYCQLFSEPNAGSDLASLQCRAERDGETWVLNGQKVWTSRGRIANKAMLVARTDFNVAKHAGISYFFIEMDQPGVELRPLKEMTGRSFFNEVFLTDARVHDSDLIGGEGNGWLVANTNLSFERALSGGGEAASSAEPGAIAGNLGRRAGDFSSVGSEPSSKKETTSSRLIGLARKLGRNGDDLVRDGVCRLYTLERLIELNSRRARDLSEVGQEFPGQPNCAKMAENNAFRLSRELIFSILGPLGALHSYGEGDTSIDDDFDIKGLGELVELGLFASGPPIYGGTDQIQRNILGERVLGLPREPSVDKVVPFRDLARN